MRDIPIIFSAPMVKALLEGRKTQTRRLAWWGVKVRVDGGPSLGPVPAPWQRVQPGDRLWVREAWGINDYRHIDAIPKQRPGDLEPDALIYFATESDDEIIQEMPRRPSIHMPRWASRITLTVTEVRVQRLQDISRGDAISEGIAYPPAGMTMDEACEYGVDPRGEFRSLWNSLHGPGSWDANPEVVALTFTVQRGNIDA